MSSHKNNKEQRMPRREFVKTAAAGIAAVSIPAASYARILRANDRVRVGIVGFSDRFRQALLPASKAAGPALNCATVPASDIWTRRRADNHQAANEFIRSGKFGDIVMAEMTWNVNQPGRWRRPQLVSTIKETDTDWKRFLAYMPFEAWDPRKYLEYRLFWPYSSGIPDQWMVHQIDPVHCVPGS